MVLVSVASPRYRSVLCAARLDSTAQAPDIKRLRVLVANERQDRLAIVAALVAELGHEVIAPQIEVTEVGPVTAREHPDVAFVGLGESSEHALELIEQIVHEAACPVVALLHQPDAGFVIEAAKRGIFAYITDLNQQEWQSSIEIVLRRFAEYRDLEGAFKRRTLTERAKGILMERHAVGEERAFQMLRDYTRTTQSTLVDTAQAIVDGTLRIELLDV
jgi:response regulator NasT